MMTATKIKDKNNKTFAQPLYLTGKQSVGITTNTHFDERQKDQFIK